MMQQAARLWQSDGDPANGCWYALERMALCLVSSLSKRNMVILTPTGGDFLFPVFTLFWSVPIHLGRLSLFCLAFHA
ncbi:hypothetical protein BDV59DRAFT_90531 [Aspergillus ambiguus]|uniref:uncharacterized protein n=1 Tax=Aspergillus ambiguus TaxID=176160 RepID=UPI003CCCE018